MSNVLRVCNVCGEDISGGRPDRRFCGYTCRMVWHKARKRDEREARPHGGIKRNGWRNQKRLPLAVLAKQSGNCAVPLAGGGIVVVSEQDFNAVMRFKWRELRHKGVTRVVMVGDMPHALEAMLCCPMEVEQWDIAFVDGRALNCTRENMRAERIIRDCGLRGRPRKPKSQEQKTQAQSEKLDKRKIPKPDGWRFPERNTCMSDAITVLVAPLAVGEEAIFRRDWCKVYGVPDVPTSSQIHSVAKRLGYRVMTIQRQGGARQVVRMADSLPQDEQVED
jgi:hypothetical protein